MGLLAIIPVLLPSRYLDGLKSLLCSNELGVRINFIYDYFKNVEKLPSNKIISETENAIAINGVFGSPGAARNEGIKLSQSEYVCFWDVDDEPNLDEVVNLVEKMNLNNADVGIGNWSVLEQDDNPMGTDVVSVGKSPGIWRFVFRREFINGIFFSDLKWGEDQLFIAQVLARNPKVITSEKVIYSYRRNSPGGLTTDNSHVVHLLTSISEIALLANKSHGKFGLCLEIMLLKQLITVFKYGDIRLGISATLIVVKTHKKTALIRNVGQLLYKASRRWN